MIERARTLAVPGTGFAIGLAMVGAYVVLRTLAVPESVLLAWIAVAAMLTLVSPLAGLTMLAALGPFTEAQTADGRVTAVPYLLAATGLSLVIHVARTRALPRLSVPMILAAALLVGTAAGVAVSAVLYGSARGADAFQLWVPGIGGAMTVLLAATWVAWRGDIRPMFVAVAAISVGALLSVLNAIANDAVLDSPIGWLLRFDIDPRRLGGLLPVPNTAAALFLVGLIMSLTIVFVSRSRGVRVAALAAVVIQGVALFFTFSRSGYLALGFAVVLLIWRRWPRLGWKTLVIGLAVGIPVFVWLWLLRDVPAAADQNRFTAWQATAQMWLANPILGAGFRSFEWLHADYGSPIIDAPHNEWLRLFGEEGTLVGILGVAFALATPIVLLRCSNLLAAGAGAAAAGLFLSATFNNPFLNSQLNVPAFLIIGMGLGIAAAVSASRDPPGAALDADQPVSAT
ncbi:MAG TPA: O-antigen ligase family protein [Candidatus Limnocylindrales bacterium]|nr:O-antigen ligase family protein [Candidatus Limnocylindrales bacterium]